MTKIWEFMVRKKQILVYFTYVLFLLYFFTSVFFDRPNLSIIPNSILIILFLVSFLKIFLYKLNLKNKPFLFLLAIFIPTILSNIIHLNFSYNFLLLILIAASSIIQSYLDKNNFLKRLFLTLIIGYSIGFFLIIVFCYKDIFNSFQIKSNNIFMNIDRMASLSSNLLIISVISIGFFKKTKLMFLPITGIIISCLILFLTLRMGSLIKVFIILLIFLLLKIKEKSAKIFNFLIVFGPVILGLAVILLLFTNLIPRLNEAVLQIFNLGVVIEGSTRERVMMIIRDLLLIFMFPLFGGGDGFIISFNITVSHNFFGDIGVTYGLLLSLFFLFLLFKSFIYIKKVKGILKYYLISFCVSTIFSIFYGMSFTTRVFYFELGYVIFLIFESRTSTDIVKILENKNEYWEVIC